MIKGIKALAWCLLVAGGMSTTAGLILWTDSTKAAPVQEDRASDAYVRQRVVKLFSDKGSCSGVQVILPSLQVATLTAGHCRLLVDEHNETKVEDESGKIHRIKFIAESPDSDLLLFTAWNKEGVETARDVYTHQRVHTMTRGKGFLSYRTDGEVIGDDNVQFVAFPIEKEADKAKCLSMGPKAVLDTVNAFVFQVQVCAIRTIDTVATAQIVPGSSGGPLFNDIGELVGIASASADDDFFGRYVKLSDIQMFLESR